MGAVVGSLRNTSLDTGMDFEQMVAINEYWEEARGLYAPFESGQKSGSADVYDHEMPGGQYTNLLFQSQQLGAYLPPTAHFSHPTSYTSSALALVSISLILPPNLPHFTAPYISPPLPHLT